MTSSVLKKLWHFFPISFRRRWGQKLNDYKQNNIAKNLPQIGQYNAREIKSVAIIGFFTTPSGIGQAVRLLSEEIKINGIKIYEIDCSPILDNRLQINIDENDLNKVDAIIYAVNPDVLIHVLQNMTLGQLNGKKIIGYWVWELPLAPKKWKMVKHLVHEIWTPSEFSKQALSKVFEQPIKVVNHPAAIKPPLKNNLNSREQVRGAVKIPNDAFVGFQSISFASSLERKNTIDAISIFIETFSENENAYFIIRYHGANEYPLSLQRLKLAASKREKQIILIDAKNCENELFDFYNASDAYISLHRSEGFGLNLAEAMLFGLPIIATNWSGNLEFCNPKNSVLVDFELIKVHDFEGIYNNPKSYWASPVFDDAKNKLRRLADDVDFRNSIARNGQKEIINKLKAKKLF